MNRVEYILKRLNGKVLDIGYYACTLHEQILKKHGRKNIFGFDIEIEKNADKKYYKKGNAEIKLHYKKNEFDTIIAGEVIEHLKKPENFIKEANRILKKNGILIITTPNKGSLINRIFHNNETPIHYSLFHWSELKQLLEKRNFEIKNYNTLAYTLESSEGTSNPWSFKLRRVSDFILPKSLREEHIICAVKK